jgi:Uma2 family endonuclease
MTETVASEGFTRADLDAMYDQRPDDRRRYELIGGAIVVTPSPRPVHQVVSGNLHLLLRAACPADLVVLYAPLDVVLAENTVVQPDLLVSERADLGEKDVAAAPLLVVEILSPSTRLIDLRVKLEHYQRAGCAAYWIVDPVALTVTVLENGEGGFVHVATVTREQARDVTVPFPVTVSPGSLLD